MCSTYLIVVALLGGCTAGDDSLVILENEHLLVAFSAQNGSMTRLRNKRTEMELISVVPGSPQPWALMLAPGELIADSLGFRIKSGEAGRSKEVKLEWETRYGITVRATARLDPSSDELELRCSAENHGTRTILALRYPAIQGIGTLSTGGKQDRLLHSTMMGALFFDPFHLFRGGSPSRSERGMLVSRYPNGFHGSALQLMSYFAEGRGGFSFTTKDRDCADKDLNFYKAADDKSLVCEVAHIQEDARPGKSLIVDYPVVIAALKGRSWQAAAERYRTWALQQPWCQRGSLDHRVTTGDACRWLLENTGAVGAWWPFRNDIRPDILRTRQFWGAPILHLELWWSHGPSRQAAQSDGDHFGPFFFPFLALRSQETFRRHTQDPIVPPANPISPDWIAMCPVQPDWRKVVSESAEDMVGTKPLRHHQIWVDENRTGCAADCLYYDIGPCAGVPTHCYAQNHAHPPGAGHTITQAYVSLVEESRQRASRIKGSYVPVGTECVTEPFVGCLDFYYARNAGLNPDMETFPYVRDLTWLPDGRMEIVPLFPFIYHEHGPVAVQGIYPVAPWDVTDAEDFFTWAEARAVLWGGLIVTFPAPSAPAPTAARVRFLRGLAAARTGFAREFLAYGRMQAPPALTCGTLDIDHGLAAQGWLRKIRFPHRSSEPRKPAPSEKTDSPRTAESKDLSVEQWATGLMATPVATAHNPTLKVPSVLCQPYTLGDRRLGMLLVNLRPDGEENIHLPVDPASYGLPPGTYEMRREQASGQELFGLYAGRHDVNVKLAPRDIVLITATRQAR